MSFARLVVILTILFASQLSAQMTQTIDVDGGEVTDLRQAILDGNEFDGQTNINIEPGATFVFDDTAAGSDNALPDVLGDFVINSSEALNVFSFAQGQGFPESGGIVRCISDGKIRIANVFMTDFRTNADGVFEFVDNCAGSIDSSQFTFNINAKPGGTLLHVSGEASLHVSNTTFGQNLGVLVGGAANVTQSGQLTITDSILINNSDSTDGSALAITVDSDRMDAALVLENNFMLALIPGEAIEVNNGPTVFNNNTILMSDDVLDSEDSVTLFGNALESFSDTGQIQAAGSPSPKPESVCDSSNPANFISRGYNLSSDDSCSLDQSTDITNTLSMIVPDDNFNPVPAPGSPAIDTGPAEVYVRDGDSLASLPCSLTDLSDTARPQDGNSDGVYACDIGAGEAIGLGSIVDGHSGAFYNLSRDGEGIYVEILNATTAVIYTFTYRPDGSGPAWFIGIAEIQGNSLIVRDLLRPIGTSFGAGFDAADIEFTPAGSMNVVVPDCEMAAPGGSIAYSGAHEIGFEALLTRAQRLSNITGCTGTSTNPNDGLSGSYFDATRDGEGIIVEWLENGDVLVVFFTYDENDNQLWVLGIGTPNGKTVTMDALYASSFTRWGSDFDPDEVDITVWGTFTLTWTECGGVRFEYASTVGTYGTGMHDYTRLSTLAGTTCPDF